MIPICEKYFNLYTNSEFIIQNWTSQEKIIVKYYFHLFIHITFILEGFLGDFLSWPGNPSFGYGGPTFQTTLSLDAFKTNFF